LLDAAIGRSTNLGVTYVRCGSDYRPGQLVAPECVLAGSVLFPPGETADDLKAQIVDTVMAAAQEDEWLKENPPVVEWIRSISQGTEVPEDHPLYETVAGAIEAVTEIKPGNYPLHTGSDIRNPILHKGIPTVGFGPLAGDSTQLGGHDEWVDLDDYIETVKVVASIIVNWCGV
jgi:acetylornithine deacetylase